MSDTEMLAKETSTTDSTVSKSITSSYTSHIKLYGSAIGWIGVAIAWCVQGGYGTPYLLELGLKPSTVNYVWLAGPISGIVVQPIIGSLSDKIKQRQPFIIGGTTAVCFSMIMFSNAKWLKSIHKTSAMVVAIVMFWINDFSINALMVPLRALSSDTVPSQQQLNSFSWYAVCGGIGNFIAFGFGSFISSVPILYAIAAVLLVLTTCATLKIVNLNTSYAEAEKSYDESHKMLLLDGVKEILYGISRCPLFIWKLMLTQFLMFCACYPIWIYGTHFYGENLMNGHVDDENVGTDAYKLYQQGVRYGNVANALKGIIRIICAYLIPKAFVNITNYDRIKIFWSLSYILFGVFMCMTPWIKNIPLFIICQGLIEGVAVTSLHIFGWSFTSMYAIKFEPKNAALILSIFNLCQCFPQILMSLISGIIIESFHHNVAPLLFIGGLFGISAGFAVCFVDTQYKQTKYDRLHCDNKMEITMEIEMGTQQNFEQTDTCEERHVFITK